MEDRKLTLTINGETLKPIRVYYPEKDLPLAIWQGNRGDNPELDFIVGYYSHFTKRIRRPKHTHWMADMAVKCVLDKKLVGEYVDDMIDVYDKTEPFKSKTERENYDLIFVNNEFLSKYQKLSNSGDFKIETITAFLELFSICEKQTKNAHMFRDSLNHLKLYTQGKKDLYQLLSKSGHNGK